MKFAIYIICFTFYTLGAYAHEMIPTYPELRPSYIDGLYSTDILLFNRRKDVRYYEIQVFDKDWKPVPFATNQRVVEIEYLRKKNIELYFREQEKEKISYICTMSKILKGEINYTVITSRICSKIK
jgi:hypothetical protein